ncbi:hypothetical protein [Parerythrobacter jejuensis]|nr:hypothetical protein [Parerythrobacter jejuensis]
MENRNGEIHVDETEASGGTKTGAMRWVLGIGTLLAIILLSIIWISGALSQGDVEEEMTATGIIQSQAEEGDDTDGIVSEDADEF